MESSREIDKPIPRLLCILCRKCFTLHNYPLQSRSCGHSICITCLDSFPEKTYFRCPKCKDDGKNADGESAFHSHRSYANLLGIAALDCLETSLLKITDQEEQIINLKKELAASRKPENSIIQLKDEVTAMNRSQENRLVELEDKVAKLKKQCEEMQEPPMPKMQLGPVFDKEAKSECALFSLVKPNLASSYVYMLCPLCKKKKRRVTERHFFVHLVCHDPDETGHCRVDDDANFDLPSGWRSSNSFKKMREHLRKCHQRLHSRPLHEWSLPVFYRSTKNT